MSVNRKPTSARWPTRSWAFSDASSSLNIIRPFSGELTGLDPGRVVLASRLPAAGKQRLASQNCGNTTVRCVLADLAGDVVYVYV